MDSVNKGVANKLSFGGFMQQPNLIATQLLESMTTVHMA